MSNNNIPQYYTFVIKVQKLIILQLTETRVHIEYSIVCKNTMKKKSFLNSYNNNYNSIKSNK